MHLIFNNIPYPEVYFMLMFKLNLPLYLLEDMMLYSMAICLKSLLLHNITYMFSIDIVHTYFPITLWLVFIQYVLWFLILLMYLHLVNEYLYCVKQFYMQLEDHLLRKCQAIVSIIIHTNTVQINLLSLHQCFTYLLSPSSCAFAWW